MANSFDQNYSKWNNFKDEDSDEEMLAKKPTIFHPEADDGIEFSSKELLSAVQVENLSKLPITEKEIWQVVIRKLRVWSAAGASDATDSELIPCRPYCILVNNLFPKGQVITREVCNPPECYPNAKTILNKVTQVMLKPPKGTTPGRPRKLVLVDKSFVGDLRASFATVGVECSYLSESDGIDEYVKSYSDILIEQDIASRGDVSEKPGLLSNAGNTDAIVKSVYSAAKRFADAMPWKHLFEKQAMKLELASPFKLDAKTMIPPSSVWVAVLGRMESVFGLAVYFTRIDLERKLLPHEEKMAYIEEPRLRRCARCDQNPCQAGHELKKCTRCKVVFYCDATCQKEDWLTHKQSCTSQASTSSSKVHWGEKELSMFFGSVTTMPFDELDTIERLNLNLSIVEDLRGEAYPAFMQFDRGTPKVPGPTELFWIEQACHSVASIVQNSPTFMLDSMPSMLGGVYDPLSLPIYDSANLKGELYVSNATVISAGDFARLKEE